jgi:mannose-6-phosphate isomerase-like protein (cupin superfamily)
MKYVLALAIVFGAAILIGADTATYIGHDQVADALTKGKAITKGQGYTVSGSHRTAAGQVEVHDKETDILYIIDGEATFVTGGTMVGGKQSSPNQWLGTDIQGGETHHLTKGDIVTIPAGMPHWFKEVPKSVIYYVVKVVKD